MLDKVGKQHGGQWNSSKVIPSLPIWKSIDISSTNLFFVSFCLSNNTKKCFYLKEQLTLLLFIFFRKEMKSIEIKSKA
jgi:hypothetical protein